MTRIIQDGLEALLPGRDYLASDEIEIVEHPHGTSTCAEKVDLLHKTTGRDWKLEQMIKALFFMDKKGMQYVFVVPEFGRQVDARYHVGKKVSLAQQLPDDMELGTCTPLLLPKHFKPEGRVERIYIHQQQDLDDALVDISIGGRGPEAHKRSAWIRLGLMTERLLKRYGDRVFVGPLQFRESKPYKPIISGSESYDR